MLADSLSVLDLWDLSRPTMPPRSRLHHLEPVGIGTPDVESLSGYVARLAGTHGVSTRQLIVAEVLPLLGRSHLLGPVNRGLSAFWQRETGALNGTRTLARDVVLTLERLTLRHGLRFLTLLSWAAVLPSKDLLRPKRAWCPACYEEWRQAGQVIYEPLLWSLLVIEACPRHRRRLQLRCPYPDCRRPLPALAQRARPGHCSACERWLGTDQEPVGDEALTEDELRWQTWVTQAIGELLATAPGLSAPPRRESVVQAIDRHVRQMTGGNVTALADRLGLRMVTLANWRKGKAIPCLALLLRLCHRLGMRPLDFLSGEVASTIVEQGSPTLPPELPQRQRAERRRLDWAQLQRTLEAVLASDEWPPPPMREVARRISIDHTCLLLHLREPCQAISARYLAYQQEQGARKRQHLCEEVRQAVFEVHGQGRYPSANRVAPLISQPGFIRDPDAQASWRQALVELGWRT